ncbi:hypothetical protein LCGC14_0441270 [marine sediment metagenome]|uniref:Uncharacterized protein n=1 Tax=marine sediment metagenome TaxID=412755 RepID=A0A0F9SK96_9ZZZZ
MGLWANTINKLQDVLEANIASGQPLQVFRDLVVGEQEAVTSLKPPFLWLHLDTDPIIEDWHAAKDRKQAEFTCLVHVVVPIRKAARPYGVEGDSAQFGVLVGLADVMNVIDSNRSAIIASDLDNVDMNLGVRAVVNQGNKDMNAIIAVTFLQQYGAGGR